MSGATAVVVPYNTTRLGEYLDGLHGMVFCGGAIESKKLHTDTQYKLYMRTFHRIFDYAVQVREQGGSFTLWGTCLGFEILGMLGDPPPDTVFFDNLQEARKETFAPLTVDPRTRIGRLFSPTLRAQMQRTPCCRHRHKYGFALTSNYLERMARYLDIVSVDATSKGVEFVNIFEYKELPFYGVQWHVEKPFNALSKKLALILSNFLKREASRRGRLPPLNIPHQTLDSVENVILL